MRTPPSLFERTIDDLLNSDCRFIVSCSGGKDSTALYLWALERFGKDGFEAVFADTGHEHRVTVNYVRHLHLMAGGPEVARVQADYTRRVLSIGEEPTGNPFVDLTIFKRRVPSTKAQFCTEYLKLRPIRDWLDHTSDGREPVQLVGVRRAESRRRSTYPELMWSTFFDCYTWHPLIDWSREQVVEMHRRHGVPLNPLYDAGFSRVGCFPCIHSRKSELARLPDWCWAKLAAWEKRIGRSFFPPGLVPGVLIPTTEVVRRWARTKRGGREEDPDAPEAVDVPRCMAMWGMCE